MSDALKIVVKNATIEERLDGLDPWEIIAEVGAGRLVAQLEPEEVLKQFKTEQRLAGLRAEERLVGLKAEERLAGLDEAEAVLAMPLSVLRGLSPDYIEALPEHIKLQVKARLAQN